MIHFRKAIKTDVHVPNGLMPPSLPYAVHVVHYFLTSRWGSSLNTVPLVTTVKPRLHASSCIGILDRNFFISIYLLEFFILCDQFRSFCSRHHTTETAVDIRNICTKLKYESITKTTQLGHIHVIENF